MTHAETFYETVLTRTNEILAEEHDSGPVQSRQVKSLIRALSEILAGEDDENPVHSVPAAIGE